VTWDTIALYSFIVSHVPLRICLRCCNDIAPFVLDVGVALAFVGNDSAARSLAVKLAFSCCADVGCNCATTHLACTT